MKSGMPTLINHRPEFLKEAQFLKSPQAPNVDARISSARIAGGPENAAARHD
jgi:hypothetical protein